VWCAHHGRSMHHKLTSKILRGQQCCHLNASFASLIFHFSLKTKYELYSNIYVYYLWQSKLNASLQVFCLVVKCFCTQSVGVSAADLCRWMELFVYRFLTIYEQRTCAIQSNGNQQSHKTFHTASNGVSAIIQTTSFKEAWQTSNKHSKLNYA
jgi:hypothetical protein